MKRTLLSLCLCLSVIITFAQVTDFFVGVDGPSGLFIDGEDLYVSEYYGGVVSRINLDDNPPNKTPILTNLGSPFGVGVTGNYLFVAEQTGGRVSYIDISSPIIAPNSIPIAAPSGLTISDNIVYCTDGNNIRFIDTSTQPFSDGITISGGLVAPTGVAVIGNELFIANFTSGIINKIDLTQANPQPVTVVSSGINNPNHLFAYGNELYFSQFSVEGKISKIDVTETNPTVVDIANGFNPTGIAIKDGVLYFSEFGSNKISRLDLVVSVQQPTEEQLLIYPNPTSDNLILDNLTSTIDVNIIDMSGKIIQTVPTDGIMDVSGLSSGIYFIQSENFSAIKFVKQ